MHLTPRWILANLRVRRAQAALSIGVIAGVVAALIVGLTLLEGTLDPWSGVFARSNGAQVWVHTHANTQLNALAGLDDVTAMAGPYQTATVRVVQNGDRTWLGLRAMGPRMPAVGKPLMVHGHWLTARDTGGVVLERTYADALGLGVGSPIHLRDLAGRVHTFTVVGTCDTSDQAPYADGGPELGMVLPAALATLRTDPQDSGMVVGLRLSDSGADSFVAQQAVAVLPEDSVVQISKWRDVRASMEVDNRLLGLFLALFGVVGLVSAAMALANAAGGWVLAQLRDLAVLKVIGLTPRQVMRLLLVEQGVLGLAGIVVGVLVARVVTSPWVTGLLADSLVDRLAVPISTASVLLIAVGTAIVLMLATLPPAWHGSRVTPVSAVGVAPPAGRLSRLARVALVAHLPPALVLGARDTFTRRTTALLTVVALAVPMAMATIGLGCLATLHDFEAHPAQIGLAGMLTVRAGTLTDQQAQARIRADPGVAAVYPGANTGVLLPGQARTVQARAIGTSARPYPFPITDGRLYRAPGEAVAGQGLLTLMHAHVGERVSVRVDGVQMNLHIVGRTIEPADDGQVLSFGLDTLNLYEDSTGSRFFSVKPVAGADVGAIARRLSTESGGTLDVQRVANPVEALRSVRVLVPLLIAVLTLIGLANLLTATGVELRDHERNAGVLRAIGLTPRQVLATLVTRTVLLVLVAAAVGVAAGSLLGPWLIDMQGRQSGVGAGIGRPPAPLTLLATVAATVAMAGLVALVPGRRVARADVPFT